MYLTDFFLIPLKWLLIDIPWVVGGWAREFRVRDTEV